MTAEELVTELLAEGFDYLSQAKALNYINDGYLVDVCEAEDWPFLEELVTGTAPMTLANLRRIDHVIDRSTERKLEPIDKRNLTDDYTTNLGTGGSPRFYFVSYETKVYVYPANTTDSIICRYYKTPPRLSGSGVPLMPERFHSLIVDAAVARAYENSDDYELRQNAEQVFQVRLQKMREALLYPYRDGPSEYIAITDPDYA